MGGDLVMLGCCLEFGGDGESVDNSIAGFIVQMLEPGERDIII